MAGMEHDTHSKPAIIRVHRLVLGAPSACATDTAVWGAVRRRRGVRKLDFVKVTTSGSRMAGWTPPGVRRGMHMQDGDADGIGDKYS